MITTLKRSASVGTTFQRGLDVYKKNFVPLMLATLLALLIGGASCGICAGPLFCGVFMMVLNAMRNDGVVLKGGDVFKGFQKFLPAFVACLVLGMINSIVCSIFLAVPILGWIAAIVICDAAMPAGVCWSQLLVADKNATIGDAILVPLKLLGDKKFWSVVLVTFVASLVGSLGAVACGIGIIATLPFAYCMIAAAYEEVYSDAGTAPEAPAETPAADDASAE